MANIKNAGWGAYVPVVSQSLTITGQLARVSKKIGKIPKVQKGMLASLNNLVLHVEKISGKINAPVIDRISPSAMLIIHSLNLARTALSDAKAPSTPSTNAQLLKHRQSKNYSSIESQLKKLSPDLHREYVKQFWDIPHDAQFEVERLARMGQLIEFERKIVKAI